MKSAMLTDELLDRKEAPRGGAGIEIAVAALASILTSEAPRGGAGIEMAVQRCCDLSCPKPLVEGLVLKFEAQGASVKTIRSPSWRGWY